MFTSVGFTTKLTPENLTNKFFNPFLHEMKDEMRKPVQVEGDFYKPTTLASKLAAMKIFLAFTKEHKTFFGLHFNEISILMDQLCSHSKGLF